MYFFEKINYITEYLHEAGNDEKSNDNGEQDYQKQIEWRYCSLAFSYFKHNKNAGFQADENKQATCKIIIRKWN